MPRSTAGPAPPSAEPKNTAPLFLDREGRWFHDGVEITHERTRLLFSKSIRRRASGTYCLQIGSESAEVVVEDAPYTVLSVTIQEDPDGFPQEYILHLNDETEERLESGSLFVGAGDVMYCKVKGGLERARFLRPAYYQICAKLEYDARNDRYGLPSAGGGIAIRTEE
jgi:hypothetical protein